MISQDVEGKNKKIFYDSNIHENGFSDINPFICNNVVIFQRVDP